jgi:diguanylate cyclase (GGDEF)-like protein
MCRPCADTLVVVRTSQPPIAVLAVGFDPGVVAGATVETADDLLGALAQLTGGGVDVVLLALDTPDTPGVDAVRSIQERAPDVPVIGVLSADDADRDTQGADRIGGADGAGLAERAIDAGASDVVSAASPELLARAVQYATSLRRLENELERGRIVDEVTGLYTARGLEHLASHHLAFASRSKVPVTLVFVRLDRLDTTPDDDADQDERHRLVAEAADVLRAAVRSSDVLARVGPSSFCVLLTGDAWGADAVVLSRLVEAIAESNARSGRSSQLSVSVGAAAYDPDNPVSLEALIEEADRRTGTDVTGE